MGFKKSIIEYFKIIDDSLDILSQHNEGKLQYLPSWVLQKRRIEIGVTPDQEGFVLKIDPDDNLEDDEFLITEIVTAEDASKIIAPMTFQGCLPNKQPENSFLFIGSLSLVEANNQLAVPVIDNKFLLCWGRTAGFFNNFNPEKAKEEAITLWNNALNELNGKKNYVQSVNGILDKFRAIIKRKAFLERRIHRYIYEHRSIFLPSHKQCLYEHKLYRFLSRICG